MGPGRLPVEGSRGDLLLPVSAEEQQAEWGQKRNLQVPCFLPRLVTIFLFAPSHTHASLAPSGPGLQSFSCRHLCEVEGFAVLISALLCGFPSLRLTFQHHLPICFSASKILLTPSRYPFGFMPFVSFCFHFRAVSGLNLSYLIRSPINIIQTFH